MTYSLLGSSRFQDTIFIFMLPFNRKVLLSQRFLLLWGYDSDVFGFLQKCVVLIGCSAAI